MIAAVLVTVQLAAAQAEPVQYAKPGLLIEPAAVITPTFQGGIRVLDLRGAQKYADGHVVGAVSAPLGVWSKAVADGKADARFWRKELAAVGVRPDVPVAVYSDDPRDAARGWWLLKLAGVPDVRIMNGGWDAYRAAQGRVTKEAELAAADPVNWTPAAARLATKADVLSATQGKPAGVQLVDARSPEEYAGTQKAAAKAGHVPGAISDEWTNFIDPRTQRFRTPAELRRELADRGIDPTKPAITYCQSGGRSSVAAFALELMGVPEVRNYYRGWAEWGNDPDAPAVTSPLPKK